MIVAVATNAPMLIPTSLMMVIAATLQMSPIKAARDAEANARRRASERGCVTPRPITRSTQRDTTRCRSTVTIHAASRMHTILSGVSRCSSSRRCTQPASSAATTDRIRATVQEGRHGSPRTQASP